MDWLRLRSWTVPLTRFAYSYLYLPGLTVWFAADPVLPPARLLNTRGLVRCRFAGTGYAHRARARVLTCRLPTVRVSGLRAVAVPVTHL